MQADGSGRKPPTGLPDGAVWQRSNITDAAEDEAARLLDLAGFADGLLDPDDRERVAEWLTRDPAAAEDVAAARALAGAAGQVAGMPEAMVARACALVRGDQPRVGNIIPFPLRHSARLALHGMARWSSLAAAVAVASWLGFTLGMDTSRSIADTGRSADEGALHELLDPSTGLLRDLTEGAQT